MGHFGACPRVFCNSTHVLPCGRTDLPGLDTVKLYCPNCGDIYTPPSSKYQGVDGMPFAFFTSHRRSLTSRCILWFHLFLLVLPDVPRTSRSTILPNAQPSIRYLFRAIPIDRPSHTLYQPRRRGNHHQSKPTWRSETGFRKSLYSPYIRIQSLRESKERTENEMATRSS